MVGYLKSKSTNYIFIRRCLQSCPPVSMSPYLCRQYYIYKNTYYIFKGTSSPLYSNVRILLNRHVILHYTIPKSYIHWKDMLLSRHLCRQHETFHSFLEKQLQNQTCLMLAKVCPLKSYRIWTKILSLHKKTNIYAAVGRFFEFLKIDEKFPFFVKKNFKSEYFC